MANAYSTAINYGSPIPVGNTIQYLGAIQQGMQQKFDINLAKIDDLISKVATVPLARDKDKKYLGDKLQGLLSMVDANSKIDLTDNVVARQISSYVTSAIDDNVKEQLVNSQKIANYQQTAAQRKKDKPELYNDANYAYGLDKSGYADYMNEKSDSLGSMDYVDYYDVDKNLNKELEAFAKERGFEKVLDSTTEAGYIYKTVKGKELTEEEVSNFFDSKMSSDPKLRQQFMINAHYNHRGISDADLIKAYKEQAEPILKDYDTQIGDVDSKLKNVNPDDKATADLLHRKKSELQQQKDSFSSQLDEKNFNRDTFLYGQYSNNVKRSYMKTYAYSAVTDIKYDDFLLQIAKAKGELSADGTPLAGGVPGTGGGTLFQRAMPALDQEEKPNYMTDFNTKRATSWTDLQNVIKSQLVQDGKQPTVANITSYYAGLKKAAKEGYDLNAQGYDSQVLSAYGKVENLNKTASQLTKVAKEHYGKAANDILIGLWGGKGKDLNIEGLISTMPHTGALLKKYKTPDQMTQKEKAIALYEVSQNLKDHVLEGEDAKNIQFYTDALKRENNLSKQDIAKVKQAKQGLEDSAMWEVASTYGNRLLQVPGNILSHFTTWRPEAIQQANAEFKKNEIKYQQDLNKAWKHVGEKIGNFFTSDTNLSELQSGDIKLGNYEGVEGRMGKVQTSVKSRFDAILSKNKESMQKESSIILNPSIKTDKPYLDALSSAIVAQGRNPAKDSFITVKEIKGGEATLIFSEDTNVETKAGGTKKQTEAGAEVVVPVSSLPQGLIKNLQTSLSDWSYSVSNPSGMKVSMSYSPPENLESRYELAQKYLKNNSTYMSPEEAQNIQMTGFSALKTKDDYRTLANKLLPAEYSADFTDRYLKSKYAVKWERPEGGGGFIGYLTKDGQKIEQVPPLGTDYNPHVYGLYTMKVVNQYLENQIGEYRRKSLASRN